MKLPEEEGELLAPLEDYLKAGVHIGTSSGMKSMEWAIYRTRSDGLYVLDVHKTDERIRTAGQFLARQDITRVVACSVRAYGIFPVEMFSKVTGALPITGRFIPGIFTNPHIEGRYKYHEPSTVLITDPHFDRQALKEAARVGVPVVSLVDTDNVTKNVDLAIPCNNKGRNSLAMIFWLLTKEVLKERGELTPEKDAQLRVEHFRAPRGRRPRPAGDTGY
ncbi:MAG: 30S ribosomal protein S2 [Candidatus Heimdallarchaeota archaeon]|nr:MAG: 30S ribosomal protein S2 [Candidatus Heimdallarchaeota archaeon]